MLKMCKSEDSVEEWEMKVKLLEDGKVDKLKNSMASRSSMKVWMIRAITTVLLWTCVVQLMALGEMWGPRLLKGWPSCFSHPDLELTSVPAKVVLPPKSEFQDFLLFILVVHIIYCKALMWLRKNLLIFINAGSFCTAKEN